MPLNKGQEINSSSKLHLNCVFELKQMVRKLISNLEKGLLRTVEQDKFIIAFKESFALISSKSDFNDMMEVYHVACRFIPSLHVHAGTLLIRLGLVEEAMGCFRCGVEALPEDLSAVYQLENACCSLVERWHFSLLNDVRRNACYRDAILSAVAANHKRILDIGAGTGLLACYCARSPVVKPVFACEDSSTLCAVASAVFSKNNFSSSDIKLIKLKSTELTIPRDIPFRVSLVVTEVFDSALFGGGILKSLQHAWKELLLPPVSSATDCSECGLVIPKRASVYACAIQCQSIRKENRLLSGGAYRFISSATTSYLPMCRTSIIEEIENYGSENASEISNPEDSLIENYSTVQLSSVRGGYKQLTDEFLLTNVNFNNPKQIDTLINTGLDIIFELSVKTKGILDAVTVFFDLDLSDDTVRRSIGNRPNNNVKSSWEQAVFPVLPIHFSKSEGNSFLVHPGDKLKIEASLNSEGSCLSVRCFDIIRQSVEISIPLSLGDFSKEPPLILPFGRSDIRYLNDTEHNFSFCRLLEYAYKADNCRSVLILSSNPNFLSLQAALIGYTKVVHVIRHSHDALSLSNLFDKLNQVEEKLACEPQYVVGSVEQLAEESTSNAFDLVISELVEPCGTFRQQSVEELQLAKMMLLASPALVAPYSFRIYGTFVESDILFEQNAALRGNNDGVDCSSTCKCVRTCQIHVADFINLYRVRNSVDIDLSALRYRELSERFLIFSIHLNDQRMNNGNDETTEPNWFKSVAEHKISISSSGRLAALIYWFEIDLIDNFTARRFSDFDNIASDMINANQSIFTINTLRSSSHFRQSAVMVAEDRPISVISGYELKTRFVFHNSCLTFSFLGSGRASSTAGLLL